LGRRKLADTIFTSDSQTTGNKRIKRVVFTLNDGSTVVDTARSRPA
jgi:hypothetical protein